MAIGTWLWSICMLGAIHDGPHTIKPGITAVTGPFWPVTGTSIIKVNVEKIPGQHIVLTTMCGIPFRLERERYECYNGKLPSGVDYYIGITTKNENIMLFFDTVLEYGELKPHRFTCKVITDKDEVEKIVQEILDLGA